MIIVSSRKDFTNPNRLLSKTKQHQFGTVDLIQDTTSYDLISEDDFLQKLSTSSNKRILMLVHGYNNEYNKMCYAYSMIEANVARYLKGQYGLVIGYSWPGGKHRLAWWLAKCNADKTAKRFKSLIERIYKSSPNISLDVMSHSLGARVILKTLKQFPAGDSVKQPVRNYFCMAAAVDNEVLEPKKKFYAAVSRINNIYVFHSKHDQALRSAYKISKLDRALGARGPQNINKTGENIYVANCENWVKSHGDYKGAKQIYQYIQRALLAKNPIKKIETL